MSIFGMGFRLLFVALALVIERVGALLRDNPWAAMLRDHPLVQRFIASPPEGYEDPFADDHPL